MAPATDTSTDWNKGEHDGFVNIAPNQDLHIKVVGPNRDENVPVAIIIAGLGDDGIQSYAAVFREMAPFIRTYSYSRLGLGLSSRFPRSAPEEPTNPKPEASLDRSALAMATEGLKLLEAASITPPYILVAHSYGGLIAREMLSLLPKDAVHGMLFIDANQERTHYERPFDQQAFGAIIAGLDYYKIIGVVDDHALTSEEVQSLLKGGVRHPDSDTQPDGHAAAAEEAAYDSSGKELATKRQFEHRALGDWPLSVIMANNIEIHKRVWAAAKERGNGTEEQWVKINRLQADTERYEEEHQREQMLLTTGKSRFVKTEKSAHNVQLTEPDLIAREVKWVLDMIKEKRSS
ncbi:hypothetical protein MMC25_005577 [Agyrium rufum]|nr:hypothetical protein [Agyrium rufum]